MGTHFIEAMWVAINVNVDRDLQLACEGDVRAFERLYKAYHRRVYSVCMRMTRNESEAEDLTQDVFIQIYS